MGDTITSLRLLELRGLLAEVVRQAHDSLHAVARALPGLPDHERKRALLAQLHASRQQLQRLAVATAWSAKARAVAECRRVLETAALHGAALQESADQLAFLHGELAVTAAPPYDVPTALHVAEQGSYDLLPRCIEELAGMAPEGGTPEHAAAAAAQLGVLLRGKLIQEFLPEELRVLCMDGPVATLGSRQGTYIVRLTLVPAPTPAVTLAQYGGRPAEEEVPTSGGGIPTLPLDAIVDDDGKQAQTAPVNAAAAAVNDDAAAVDKCRDSVESVQQRGTASPGTQHPGTVSEWRWRVLGVELLPDWHRRRRDGLATGQGSRPSAGAPINPAAAALEEWIRSVLEQRMWAASDLAALLALGRLDLVRFPEPRRGGGAPDASGTAATEPQGLSEPAMGGHGTETGPLSPVKEEFEASAAKEQPGAAAVAHDSQDLAAACFEEGTTAVTTNFPKSFSLLLAQPLALMHRVLHRAAVRSALGAALVPAARRLETRGPWAGQLSLERARDVGTGIRLHLWPGVVLVSTDELRRLNCDDATGVLAGTSASPDVLPGLGQNGVVLVGTGANLKTAAASSTSPGIVLELGLRSDEDELSATVTPTLADLETGLASPLRFTVSAASPELSALLRRVCGAAAAQQLAALRAALLRRWDGRRTQGAQPRFELCLDPPRLLVLPDAGPSSSGSLGVDHVTIAVDPGTGAFVLFDQGGVETPSRQALCSWLEAARQTGRAGPSTASPGLVYVDRVVVAVNRHVLAARWHVVAGGLETHALRVLGSAAAPRHVPTRVLQEYSAAEAASAVAEEAGAGNAHLVSENGVQAVDKIFNEASTTEPPQAVTGQTNDSHSGALALDLCTWPGDGAMHGWVRRLPVDRDGSRNPARRTSCGPVLASVLLRLTVSSAAPPRLRCDVLLQECAARGGVPLRVLGLLPCQLDAGLPGGTGSEGRLPSCDLPRRPDEPSNSAPSGARKRGREAAEHDAEQGNAAHSIVSSFDAEQGSGALPDLDLVAAADMARDMRAWCQLATQLATMRLAAREAWVWDAAVAKYARVAVVPAPRGLQGLDAWTLAQDSVTTFAGACPGEHGLHDRGPSATCAARDTVTFAVREAQRGAWEATVPSEYFASWRRRFEKLGVRVQPKLDFSHDEAGKVPRPDSNGAHALIPPGFSAAEPLWTVGIGPAATQSPLRQTEDGLAFAGYFDKGESILPGTAALLSAIRLHCFLTRMLAACKLIAGGQAVVWSSATAASELLNGHHGDGLDIEMSERESRSPRADGVSGFRDVTWTVPGGGTCRLACASLRGAEFVVTGPLTGQDCPVVDPLSQNGPGIVDCDQKPSANLLPEVVVTVEWVATIGTNATNTTTQSPAGTASPALVACCVRSLPALPAALTAALEAAADRGDEVAFLDGLAGVAAVTAAAAAALNDDALRAAGLLPGTRRWLGGSGERARTVEMSTANPAPPRRRDEPQSQTSHATNSHQISRLGLAPQTLAAQVCQGGRAVELEVGGYVGGMARLALRFGRLARGTPRSGADGSDTPADERRAWVLTLYEELMGMAGATPGDKWQELGQSNGIRKLSADPCLASSPAEALAGKRFVVWVPQAAAPAAIASVLRAVAGA